VPAPSARRHECDATTASVAVQQTRFATEIDVVHHCLELVQMGAGNHSAALLRGSLRCSNRTSRPARGP
jgi:hypothetical protein